MGQALQFPGVLQVTSIVQRLFAKVYPPIQAVQVVGEPSQDEHGGLHFYMHFPFESINYPRQAVHSVAVQVLHPLEHATH